MRVYIALATFALLTACGPLATGLATPSGSPEVIAATAGVGTAFPSGGDGTPVHLPTRSPTTPIPTLPAGSSPTVLKYRLLGEFPDLFFCDPDYYPVARADEAELATERFPELQANAEEFRGILEHNGLGDLTTFTNPQKLLIYREHKRLAAILFELSGDDYAFHLRTADSNQEGFDIQGLISARGAITIQHRDPAFTDCPICLAGHTLIDTPSGEVEVEDLRVGGTVWTSDSLGARYAAVVLKTTRVPASASHQMVHLTLEDGRSLWASPGHPTADGRRLGDLMAGDPLDGSYVRTADRVGYDQAQTYDLLPSGGAGYYWANGILVGSTLAHP
jgi:hypothetical protein